MPSAGTQNAGSYSAVLTNEAIAPLLEDFVTTYEILLADGDTALASLLRRAVERLEADCQRAAEEVAALARQFIREEEATSRVRPDSGGDGGNRLEDYLGESYALTGVPGSVGVNYEPSLYANVPWWWTNEQGYSGHIGRVVHGFFYEQGFTGRSRPDPSSFREHPLFRAEGPQKRRGHRQDDHSPPRKGSKGQRPGMLIKNPIPRREFVLRGYKRAEVVWHERLARAKARFNVEMDRIIRLAGEQAAARAAELEKARRGRP